MNRGDVVIVDLRPQNTSAKVRPVLIVQNNQDNARLTNTIVAQITGNTSRVHEDTQLLLDQGHPDFTQSGLRKDSAVNCSNIYVVDQQCITRTLGSLSAQTMQEIDECLKAALGIA